MSNSLSRRRTGKAQQRSPSTGLRWLLLALVLGAVLIILLRMAEFTGHRVHRGARRVPPAALLP